jgi:hypothetical protein
MLQLDTAVYDPDLDIFASCHGNQIVKHAVIPKDGSTGRQG